MFITRLDAFLAERNTKLCHSWPTDQAARASCATPKRIGSAFHLVLPQTGISFLASGKDTIVRLSRPRKRSSIGVPAREVASQTVGARPVVKPRNLVGSHKNLNSSVGDSNPLSGMMYAPFRTAKTCPGCCCSGKRTGTEAGTEQERGVANYVAS